MALDTYEPTVVEAKWQRIWDERQTFRAGRPSPHGPKYILEMLPYPSGKMHMGHVRNYLLGDVFARYFRMKGFDVVHPMGWDAFGLPAENAAIKDRVHPRTRTQENIRSFKAEIRSLGYSYDWALEVNTSEPEYYRWNQWFFLKLLERDLVYRRFSKVNWCTGCLTVIANEQVKDGHCERCDSVVVDKEMPEWAFRITRYSAVLLEALDSLTEWPDRITAAQRHWIGRSEGAEVEFTIEGSGQAVRVFTTRVDTIHGCSALVLAPDHPLVAAITTDARRADVEAFVGRMARMSKTERTAEGAEKQGVATGARAVNPFTGTTVPVWIANFVLSDYGTGAVMAVPAHDARDHDFAVKYGLPIPVVIHASADSGPPPPGAASTEDGIVVVGGPYTGLSSAEARTRMTAWLEQTGKGAARVTWRQKDWGFSRQRYWGTPIPILYCERCDPRRLGMGVPYEQLPVTLPDIDTEKVLTGKGEPPLAKVPGWVNTTCPRCGGPATREVETMDTFVDSCWYFARYLSPHFERLPVDPEQTRKYLPVDVYVGGPEHATMHLLYFRFWTRLMHELELLGVDEPVRRLITQGIVNGPDGRKMSKRWGNVVAPSEIVGRYGADTARTYVLFAGPPERDFNWSDAGVEGASRFLNRVWALAGAHHAAAGAAVSREGPVEGSALATRRAAHKTLKRVSDAIERLSFNTAIAGLMEYLNTLAAVPAPASAAERAAMREALHLFTVMLVPFAPHFANEVAEAYGFPTPLEEQAWPAVDPAMLEDDEVTFAVQVKGKLRGEIRVPAGALEAEVRATAEADEKVAGALKGKSVKRVIFVPRRPGAASGLINFVTD